MTSRVWYRAVITSDQLAAGQVLEIRRQFAEMMEAAGDPEGACLFVSQPASNVSHRPETGDDRAAEAATVFFSPASVGAIPNLIVVCGAEPSPPPARECAELLVGNQRDWDLLPRSKH